MKRIIILLACMIGCALPASADVTAQQPTQISTSTPTTCQTISGAHSLLAVWNESAAAQTITITYYNDTTCTAADAFWQSVNLGANAYQPFPTVNRWLNALSYKLSGTLTGNYVYILSGP